MESIMSPKRLRELGSTLLQLNGRVSEQNIREELGKYYDHSSINTLIQGLFDLGMEFTEGSKGKVND